VAAVPGFVDYLYAVPPESTGKRRATRHMLANLAAVALFALAWWMRGGASAAPGVLPLAHEAVGVALLTAGGWMGGTLVNRNQIGVDHRYAGAGKWREETVEARHGTPVVAGKADELEVNQMKLLRAGDRRIVLGRTEQGYVAFDDRCTHRGGSLAGGVMICGTVQCPWHGSQLDVRTGDVKAGPAEQSISTYRVEEPDGEVRLMIYDTSGSRSGQATI
jgi:nitrite reductase/ring-hydroxylating ferredoxin subunit